LLDVVRLRPTEDRDTKKFIEQVENGKIK